MLRAPLRTLKAQRSRVCWLSYKQINTDVDDLLGRTLDKSYKRKETERLRSTRAEAIELYRDVWRYSRLFVWLNEQGRPWRDVLRESTRQEFELARHEQDPELVSRMIVAGRDAVQQTVDKFMARRQQLEHEARNPSKPDPYSGL